MKTTNVSNRIDFPEIDEMYEAPVIKTVEVKVEQGFQMSGPSPAPPGPAPGDYPTY